MKNLICTLALFVCSAVSSVQAQALRIVEVSAPAINCVFDPACRITVNDSSDTIPIPAGGTNFLQSRTYRARAGSAAAGLYLYQYRIDLRRAVGITYVPCLNSVSLDFGPVVSTLDLDGNGKAGDEVFVVTRGGLGTVGLASAELAGNVITFVFSSTVCAGGRPGAGDSTFFFGLVSNQAPRQSTASIVESTGTRYEVQARVPQSEVMRRRAKEGANSIGANLITKRSVASRASDVEIDRLGPKPCVDRGGTVTIYGSYFGARQGRRLVELGGHGIGVLLRVTSWSNTKISAVIPDDPRISYGQWYYIGLQNEDRHWISNISRTINICRELQ